MEDDPTVPESLVDQLNATVTRRWDLTPALAIFRVEADKDLFEVSALQYCVLALPPSFPRVERADPEEPREPGKKEKMIRVFTADKIEVIDDYATVSVRTMKDLKKNHQTTVTFSEVKYNVGIEPDIFAERYLKSPPREYID